MQHRQCQKPFLIVLVGLLQSLAANAQCPPSSSGQSWSLSPTSQRCYTILHTHVDFPTCVQKCSSIGGAPACVRDAQDNAFMASLVGQSRSAWIGYSDTVQEGSWDWVTTGCSSAFTDWGGGGVEPNNHGSGEDCAIFWSKFSQSSSLNLWNDVSCQCPADCLCEHGATMKAAYNSSTFPDPVCRSTQPSQGKCSQAYCTSPGDHVPHDCWAGSDEERCTCSQGKAKTTGRTTHHKGKKYYEYSCCTDGSGEGEECGDCCTDWVIAGIIMILIATCVACISTGIGVLCCYMQKCCCFRPPPSALPQGGGYGYGGYAQGAVVGQPVAQATVCQATVVQSNAVQEGNPDKS